MISIWYGSETGTAQDVAESLGRQAYTINLPVQVSPLDTVDVTRIPDQRLFVICCSTAGQGDPPTNMQAFWRFIMRRSLPVGSLDRCSFALVALGDSKYQKYNFVGKKLFRRLEQLGATPLLPLCLADDQHELGPDGAIDPWTKEFWPRVSKLIGWDKLPSPQSSQRLPSAFDVSYDMASSTDNTELVKLEGGCTAQVSANDKQTAEQHWQDVRLITLNVSDTQLTYKPGYVCMVQPSNPDWLVQEFLDAVDLDADQLVHVTLNKERLGACQLPVYLNQPRTVRQLAKHYFDLNGVPRRRYCFRLLGQLTCDETEREKFFEFCTAEGQEERYSYINRPRRNIVEVLQDFPGLRGRIPLEYLFEIIPQIQPRAFSIASAPSSCSVQLLVAVVRYSTRLKKQRFGTCSTWLASLSENDEVPISIRRSSLKFPTDGTPCVLVGPGTGVAPLRSFLLDQEQKRFSDSQQTTPHPPQPPRPHLLYFGCRSSTRDHLCSSDWSRLKERGVADVHTAFSRDQDEKIYVQDVMLQTKQLIWKLLNEENAYIYVCGNADRMPDDVRATFVRIADEKIGSGEEFIAQLEKSGKYQTEVWS